MIRDAVAQVQEGEKNLVESNTAETTIQEPTPAAKITTVLNSLVPTERKVAELVLNQPEIALEATAQELADIVGVGRSTVIRACQSFGYKGYSQLRVALAKQLAKQQNVPEDFDQSSYGQLLYDVHQIADGLPEAVRTVNKEVYEQVAKVLSESTRILCVAHGLSSSIALDMALRFSSLGKFSEYIFDPIGEQIAARHLKEGDSMVIISGSGSNDISLRTARAAKGSGASIIAITSFAHSPLVDLADYSLVISPISGGFQEELETPARINHFVLTSSLLNSVQALMGEPSREARAISLEIISENLSD